MMKTATIGDTQYEFPNEWSDDQIMAWLEKKTQDVTLPAPKDYEYAEQNPNLYALKETVGKVGEAIGNFPKDVYGLGKEFVGAIRHPIKTAESIGKLGAAGVAHLMAGIGGQPVEEYIKQHVPPEYQQEALAYAQGASKLAEPLRRAMNEPIGQTMERFSNYAIEHPARTLLDLSLATKGAGKVLQIPQKRLLSKFPLWPQPPVPKTGNQFIDTVAQIGQNVEKVGTSIDPFNVAGTAVRGVGKVSRKITNAVLGAFTGKNAAELEQAGKPGYLRTLLSKQENAPGEALARKAQKGFEITVGEMKAEAKKIYPELKGAQGEVNISPIGATLQDALNNFGIDYRHAGWKRLINGGFENKRGIFNIKYKGKGSDQLILDDLNAVFGRSTLPPESRLDILKAAKAYYDIGGEARKYIHAFDLDILKRKYGNMIADTPSGSAFMNRMAGATKDVIVKAVPAYGTAMEKFQDIYDFQHQIGAALGMRDSLTRKLAVDQTLRKLLESMRQDAEFRRSLIQSISRGPAENLMAELAGYDMRPLMPSGLFGRNLEAGFFFGSLWTRNPGLIAGMAAASPRVAGAVLGGLRTLTRHADVYERAFREYTLARQAATMAGGIEPTIKSVGIGGENFVPGQEE